MTKKENQNTNKPGEERMGKNKNKETGLKKMDKKETKISHGFQTLS